MRSNKPLTLQAMLLAILNFWEQHGCIIHQGYDLEVGAGTFNPATFLRALGPEPYKTAYIEPSRRPQDGRYGSHPNRLQNYHQLQVLLKPVPENFISLFINSLEAIGLNISDHDIRLVHDDWENPSIGAWGLGWEVWLNGMEITQLTYFQAVGSKPLHVISGEITYGVERIAMYLQKKNSVYDLQWNEHLTYGDVVLASETSWSHYNFEDADTNMWFRHFEDFYKEAARLLSTEDKPIPAYDFIIKASHAFNILDARGVISVTERTRYIGRIRQLARLVADKYTIFREKLHFPLGMISCQNHHPSKSIDFSYLQSTEDFLLEIGSEELPATFVSKGMQHLQALVKDLLNKHHISYENIEIWGSPRRLTLYIKQLVPITTIPASEKKGPLLNTLFHENGSLSKQGEQFFLSKQLPIQVLDDIEHSPHVKIKKINNEDYLFFIFPETETLSLNILYNELPQIIKNISFPKKMVWEYSSPSVEYARPIRWLTCLFGSEIIPLTLGSLTADRISYGHRQRYHNNILSIDSSATYQAQLREAFVIVNHLERFSMIDEELALIENLIPLQKKRLLNETSYLSEYPSVTLGSFDNTFCSLPSELLIAEMVNHQKYFPLSNPDGTIANQFAIVCDNQPNTIIIEGNEKALTPRLSDGKFLFEQDLKTSIDDLLEKLKAVTFIEEIGSLYEKTQRMLQNIEAIHQLIPICSIDHIKTAILYSKIDLVSSSVGEFPELQGVMGKYFLKNAGYSDEIAQAIEEHQTHIIDPLSISPTGTLLSIVDRLDNLLACFILDLKPTSSHDPHALRRQSLEILSLLMTYSDLEIDIQDLLQICSQSYATFTHNKGINLTSIIQEILEFIAGRFQTIMSSYAYSKGVVSSVFSKDSALIPSLIKLKASVLDSFIKKAPDKAKLIVMTYNRLGKILINSNEDLSEQSISSLVLKEHEELTLQQVILNFPNLESLLITQQSLSNYLEAIEQLVISSNQFLDNLKINVEEEAVRKQRVYLLKEVISIMSYFYKFDKLQ